jgi:hypothetical protein
MAVSTRGTAICMAAKTPTGAAIVPTAITPAAAAAGVAAGDATLAIAATTGIVAGDMVKIPTANTPGATGFPELDGKVFVVGSVGTGTITLRGANITGTTGTLAATPSLQHWAAADFTCLCLSEFTLNPGSPSTISTATFCDPTASVPSSVVEAGTINIAGFIDGAAADYKALIQADLDGVARNFRITLPNTAVNGYIEFSGVVSALSYSLPIDGAAGYSATITLGGKVRHLF